MEFPMELMRLIDTREFQRLRGVHQLGTAYFVYPGAVHTRFEHSLGTCWLTSRLLDRLQLNLEKQERLAVLAAALVHDVTHVPYGHTLEDERRLFERHDTPHRIKRFIPQGELGKALKELDLLEPVLENLLNEERWQNQIFAGAVAADLLDYFARRLLLRSQSTLRQSHSPTVSSLRWKALLGSPERGCHAARRSL